MSTRCVVLANNDSVRTPWRERRCQSVPRTLHRPARPLLAERPDLHAASNSRTRGLSDRPGQERSGCSVERIFRSFSTASRTMADDASSERWHLTAALRDELSPETRCLIALDLHHDIPRAWCCNRILNLVQFEAPRTATADVFIASRIRMLVAGGSKKPTQAGPERPPPAIRRSIFELFHNRAQRVHPTRCYSNSHPFMLDERECLASGGQGTRPSAVRCPPLLYRSIDQRPH